MEFQLREQRNRDLIVERLSGRAVGYARNGRFIETNGAKLQPQELREIERLIAEELTREVRAQVGPPTDSDMPY